MQQPREFTPQWITGALREAGVAEPVRSVEPELIGNFSNQLWRLRLEYEAQGAGPRSLVLKWPKPGGSTDAGQGLANEVRFYHEVSAELPVRTPRLWFGATDPAPLLLMEDVAGFERISWRQGASDEHARMALEALAELHAHYRNRVGELAWIPSFGDAKRRASLDESYARHWAAKRDVFVHEAPSFVEIGDALVGHVAASLAPLGEPATLLHGDAHFENLALIRAADGRTSVLFHDWAAVRRGAARFDLAVFLVMSYPPDRRRRVEERLLRVHADALRDAGVRDAGVRDEDEPWGGYRLGALAWAVRLVHFTRASASEDPIVEGSRRMVLERCTRAAVDLGTGELVL